MIPFILNGTEQKDWFKHKPPRVKKVIVSNSSYSSGVKI